MNLYALLILLDADTVIQVEHNHRTIYHGTRADFNLGEFYERHQMKAIYYSDRYKALIIEI